MRSLNRAPSLLLIGTTSLERTILGESEIVERHLFLLLVWIRAKFWLCLLHNAKYAIYNFGLKWLLYQLDEHLIKKEQSLKVDTLLKFHSIREYLILCSLVNWDKSIAISNGTTRGWSVDQNQTSTKYALATFPQIPEENELAWNLILEWSIRWRTLTMRSLTDIIPKNIANCLGQYKDLEDLRISRIPRHKINFSTLLWAPSRML